MTVLTITIAPEAATASRLTISDLAGVRVARNVRLRVK